MPARDSAREYNTIAVVKQAWVDYAEWDATRTPSDLSSDELKRVALRGGLIIAACMLLIDFEPVEQLQGPLESVIGFTFMLTLLATTPVFWFLGYRYWLRHKTREYDG